MGLAARNYDRESIEMAIISGEARRIYLERRKNELQKCREALQTGDWELITRTGHKIKGNAETFGFESLTLIGIALEKAGENKSSREVTSTLDQLDKVLGNLSADSEY